MDHFGNPRGDLRSRKVVAKSRVFLVRKLDKARSKLAEGYNEETMLVQDNIDQQMQSIVKEDVDGNIINRTILGNENQFRYSRIKEEDRIRKADEEAHAKADLCGSRKKARFNSKAKSRVTYGPSMKNSREPS